MSVDRQACQCVLCDVPDELDRRTQMTVDTVVEHGWQVIMVPEDAHGPGWAYTIGLWHGHRIPELAMFGLDVPLMHKILNDMAKQATSGLAPAADQPWEDAASVPLMLKGVDYRWYSAFFGGAIGFYRKPPFAFAQVVWPSKNGAFPWQTAGDELLDRQPRLWIRPDEHPAGVWTQDL